VIGNQERSIMKKRFIATLALAVAGYAGTLYVGAAQAEELNWINPTIQEAGAIVALPNAGMQPDKNTDYKVVFNITGGGAPEKVLAGLDRVARTVNLFTSAGVSLSRLHFVAVVHGPATPSILDDAHYKDKFGVENPNTKLIAELEKAGVQVVVCGQALAHNKFPHAWVNPQVEITLAALVDIVILQQQGYALIPL
jgi:intracellular sulfur oxidation DsrE/DsrF family protein